MTPGCRAPRDTRTTLLLLALLPALTLALRVWGFRRVYRTLARRVASPAAARLRGTPPPPAPAADSPDRLAALVIHVNRHVLPYQSKCLLESLALWYLLRRRGFAAELYLGARTLLGPLQAHAWVELDGRPLNDDDNVREVYPPFDLAAIVPDLESP